ncbi:homoserine kinase [Sandaracinobacteroides hominis]|uniref:homoserine kinase n=1 Tax=Sandaracinobacteroides hominis TaxID=2780086 RepID=UPI0018F4A97B|nr:homoserine kinase [Sandaracinobacteroides hominis]
MAVYTDVPAEALEAFLARYETGALVSAKGIAEGVSNSNFLVETTTDRFILTLYERRIDIAELPWFIELMEHLARAGLPVPRPIRDRSGEALQEVAGKAACLIQFLPGVSVSQPTAEQARSAGEALARLHLAGAGFTAQRQNGLGPDWWNATAREIASGLDSIEPGLAALVKSRLADVTANWPADLPGGTIHADLFPDNVLMLGNRVTGLIDFYFACTGLYAYDLAVLHAAWAFPRDGSAPLPAHERALFDGYESIRPLTPAERTSFPLLAQGASLRFLLSRAQDWLAPQSDALVQRKDPLPFARRLEHYARAS